MLSIAELNIAEDVDTRCDVKIWSENSRTAEDVSRNRKVCKAIFLKYSRHAHVVSPDNTAELA